MSKTYIPEGYHSELTLYETQNAIGVIHHAFEEHLGQTLNLKRVSAPLFVDPYTGLNDNLSGVERPVSFEIPATGTTAEVVHSLAKWKRMALYRYDFRPGKGLYTNMNAIRRDETLDNLHSIYVDQWDWERVITPEKRNVEELKFTVQGIVLAICDTLEVVKKKCLGKRCERRMISSVTAGVAFFSVFPSAVQVVHVQAYGASSGAITKREFPFSPKLSTI